MFNPNRCIGCQTCTMACKSTWTFSKGQELMWWNNVETKPYGGYPQHWDAKLLAMLEEANPGRQVWNAAEKDAGTKALRHLRGQDDLRGRREARRPRRPAAGARLPADRRRVAASQHPRRHADRRHFHARTGSTAARRSCPSTRSGSSTWPASATTAPIPAAWPRARGKAIYKRPEDGIVLIDQSRCRGYRKCVEGCPYKKAMYRPTTGTSEKCIGCFPRIEGKDPTVSPTGAPAETRCMAACVGKIRLQGLVKIDDDGTWAEGPAEPAVLPDSRAAGGAAAVSAVRHRAERLLHSAALGAARLPGADVRPRRRATPSSSTVAPTASCWPCCNCSAPASRSSSASRSSKARKSPRSRSRCPTAKRKMQEIFNDTVIGFNKLGEEVVRDDDRGADVRAPCGDAREFDLTSAHWLLRRFAMEGRDHVFRNQPGSDS